MVSSALQAGAAQLEVVAAGLDEALEGLQPQARLVPVVARQPHVDLQPELPLSTPSGQS